MNSDKAALRKQVREWIKLGHINPEDIPDIELYMDQVTTFMDKYLSGYKRTDEEKTLTKTMINNYTKNDLLPPSNKKKYSKEHIVILIFIYYLKNVVSINDIQVLLGPIIEDYYDNPEADNTLYELYESVYNLEKHQYFHTEKSIMQSMELTEKMFIGNKDDYLSKLSFLSLLGYDIFMKKKLMERIIDEIKEEQNNNKKDK